jgi:hypothetical protein
MKLDKQVMLHALKYMELAFLKMVEGLAQFLTAVVKRSRGCLIERQEK